MTEVEDTAMASMEDQSDSSGSEEEVDPYEVNALKSKVKGVPARGHCRRPP